MKVTAIKEGGRARQLSADVIDGCMGELLVRTNRGDGTWGASYLVDEGVVVCRAVPMGDRDNSLCLEFEFAVSNDTDVVLVDSSIALPGVLRRFGVNQEALLAELLAQVC